jgi:hypothetical protein
VRCQSREIIPITNTVEIALRAMGYAEARSQFDKRVPSRLLDEACERSRARLSFARNDFRGKKFSRSRIFRFIEIYAKKVRRAI